MALTIAEALIEGEQILRAGTVADNRRDACVLMCEVLGYDHARLIAQNRDEISDQDRESYLAAVRRRAAGEPLQYIIGHREFYGLDFIVTPDVLIPRPETEFLVEKVISLACTNVPDSPLIADIGTGSGCIAVAIASQVGRARLIATDISESALSVARSNAERHGVASRIEFLEGDLLAPLEKLTGVVDIVVSNPPYVPDRSLATLQREVRDHEPHVALSGGADGLYFYRRLLLEGAVYLTRSGFMILEIGFSQVEDVIRLGRDAKWDLVEVTNDLQGIPRTLVFQRSNS